MKRVSHSLMLLCGSYILLFSVSSLTQKPLELFAFGTLASLAAARLMVTCDLLKYLHFEKYIKNWK